MNWKENWNQSGQTPLSDQERAFDLLYHEKALMSNVTSDLLEVSPVGMRQVMQDCAERCKAAGKKQGDSSETGESPVGVPGKWIFYTWPVKG